MGIHDDIALTKGDFITNVSLLAPRSFIMGSRTVVTHNGKAIIFRKEVRHGLKAPTPSQIQSQTLSSGILIPRISISLRVGTTSTLSSNPDGQKFLSSLPPTTPLHVRIGPHPKSQIRIKRPQFLDGHATTVPIGTIFGDREALNLSGVLLTMQGSGDFSQQQGGVATVILADIRSKFGRATSCWIQNFPFWLSPPPLSPSPPFAPPDILVYNAQREGNTKETIKLKGGTVPLFNGFDKGVDVALVRACVLRRPVRIVGRAVREEWGGQEVVGSRKQKAAYIYWGVYFVR